MLPESFGGRIIYLLQQYGSSFAKGAGVSMWLALVGTLFGCIIGFLVGIVQTIPVDKNAVSYTHLTLPTKLEV